MSDHVTRLAVHAGQSSIRLRLVGTGREGTAPGITLDRPLPPQWAAAVTTFLTDNPDVHVDTVTMGCSGLGRHTAPDVLPLLAHADIKRVVLAHDSVTNFLGALGDGEGCVISANTGTICLAVGPRETARVDGWGHLIGDAGSAYWIGRTGLEAALRGHDGRRQMTSLTRAMADAYPEVEHAHLDLQASPDRVARIAAFATVVMNAAATDRVAANILDKAAAHLSEAVQIAAQDPQRTQWKQSSARMAELFDQWKTHQKSGIRLGRAAEDALWKRFRTARTTFDRHRRAFFSQLDADNSEAKKAKEALIAEAEALSGSTDWGATAAEYRRLMDRWKESKRASKKDDDALWARFRAAQDTFFAARKADNDRIDEEFEGNLAVKEQLLAEAKALLPVTDLKAAKRALGDILDRWEQAGKVPRAHMRRVEAELRTVEDAVRQVEDEKWQRSNPETKARSNSMLTQLESKIEDQEDALARAQATGDTKRAAKLEGELATSRQWLETLRRSAADLR